MSILDLFYDLLNLDTPTVCDSYEAALKSMRKSKFISIKIFVGIKNIEINLFSIKSHFLNLLNFC
jgi:hypothetical protein